MNGNRNGCSVILYDFYDICQSNIEWHHWQVIDVEYTSKGIAEEKKKETGIEYQWKREDVGDCDRGRRRMEHEKDLERDRMGKKH